MKTKESKVKMQNDFAESMIASTPLHQFLFGEKNYLQGTIIPMFAGKKIFVVKVSAAGTLKAACLLVVPSASPP